MGVRVKFKDEGEDKRPYNGYKPRRFVVSLKTRFQIFQRDNFKCVYCGATPPDTLLHLDHRVAVANGGTNDWENLVTACAECNLGKGTEDVDP